jgi:hypothetical protein
MTRLIPTDLPGLFALTIALAIAPAVAVPPVPAWVDDTATQLALDLDGDTRTDTATIISRDDGLRSAVRVCLTTREACDVIAESAATAASVSIARRAPGCHPHYKEGESPAPSRPGDVCSSADLLDVIGPGVRPSFFQYEPRTNQWTQYWLAPWTEGTND